MPPTTPHNLDAHHKVLIIGGGNAGISVAARLQRALKGLNVAIIEPSPHHYYQPLWTLVGGGVFDRAASRRPQASVIPKGVTWIRDTVAECSPEHNIVHTTSGRRIGYDYLVVAPGIQINWDAIPGLTSALGRNGVCSNYSYDTVHKTWQFINEFRGGTAIFTQPGTPIKCGGAPQKIAYLADDAFRRNGIRDQSNIIFATATAGIFAVEKYARPLRQVIARRDIDVRYQHDLLEVRPDTRQAIFQRLDTGERIAIHYNLLHAVPPMSAPDFIRNGPLASDTGWVDVDPHTLQHIRHPNIFSLGDASSLPTSKTGAAIRKQAPVLVDNLVALLLGQPLPARYDGYTACPIVTGYGQLILAEFDYDLTPRETFPFDQSRERRSMYEFKAHILPRLYWNAILKGRA